MLRLGVDTRPRLSNEVFKNLSALIYNRCGISFGESKKYLLESRLSKRLEIKNLKSFEDYYYYLMYDKDKEKEVSVLVNTIVTNETSFYRDGAQLDAFRVGVMPRVVEHKGKAKSMRLWSAACSTGEEPFTLAMMLLEEGLSLSGL